MIVGDIYTSSMCQNTHHLFVSIKFVANDCIQCGPSVICPSFYMFVRYIYVFFFLFTWFYTCFPFFTTSKLFYCFYLYLALIYTNVNRCIIRNTISINVLRIRHNRPVFRIHFQVLIHPLNHIPRIMKKFSPRRRRRSRDVHFVKGARLRSRLTIQTIGRDFDGQLPLVQNILHERIAFFFHLLLCR